MCAQSGRCMVIPQFSIRLLIVITAVVAVLAMIVSWGGQGTAWAVGATAGVLGMFVLAMLVQAALFGPGLDVVATR